MNKLPPFTRVLAFQKCPDDSLRPVVAIYVPEYYRRFLNDDDDCFHFDGAYYTEFNKEDGQDYWKAGWYECLINGYLGELFWFMPDPVDWQEITYPHNGDRHPPNDGNQQN